MKHQILLLLSFALSSQAFADFKNNTSAMAADFGIGSAVAPIVKSQGSLSDAPAGQIIFDITNNGFYALNPSGVWNLLASSIATGPIGLIGSAYITQTGSCSWVRTSTSLGTFSSNASCTNGPTVESNPGVGTIQTTVDNLPDFTVNGLSSGYYKVTFSFTSNWSAGNAYLCHGAYDGTTTSGTNCWYGGTGGSMAPVTLSGIFHYTTGGNKTFSVVGSASTGQVIIYNQTAQQQVGFIIERVSN